MKLDKKAISNAVNSLKKLVQQHTPEILTGLGIAGMVTTVVTAVRATPKAMALIEEKEVDEGRNLSAGEKIKTAWTCYVPSAVIGSVSVACLVGSTSVNIRRNAALAAACSIAENSLKEYTEKTLEVVGSKKEQQIRDAVAKDQLEHDPVVNKEVFITGRGDTLCYDVLSGRYFTSDIESVRRAVNNLNLQMRSDMYISLNDFYYELNLTPNQLGNYLGWNTEHGYIEPEFGSQLTPDGRPCLVVSHRVPPRYGFDILSVA